jgi:hypothetical protein
MMIISGATAQTGPWPPFSGFMIVYSTMWGYQRHDRPILDTLIQPLETSSNNYQRLSRRSRETRVREMAAKFCRRASIVLVGLFYMP